MTSLPPSPAPNRWLQLLAACLTAVLIPLCFTGPAVVLPSISQALGGTPVQLNWILNGYILAYGSVIMVSGSLTDLYGPRRVWLGGLAWFCAFTFPIAWAPSAGWIDFLRLMQGVGGAAAFAAAMSSLAPLFHGAARARAFSLLGTTFGIGLSFGPLVSGWLVQTAGWRWVFHGTGLVGLLGLALVAASVRATAGAAGGRFDWRGALSFTGVLGLFTYGMLLAPENGWRDAAVAGSLLASALLGIAFIVTEMRASHPMLDLSLFRSARFVGVQALAASPAFLFIALIAILPGRFIGIDGHSALRAGQLMMGLATPLLVVPFLAALLTRRFSPAALSSTGLVLAAAGLAWLARDLGGDAGRLWLPMSLIGIGLPWGLMDAMAVSVVPPERVGMATGIFNTVRVSADGVAIAVISALLATLIHAQAATALADAGPQALLQAANRAALGQLDEAARLLPGAGDLLHQAYEMAFGQVLYALAGFALALAVLVYALLARPQATPMAQVRPQAH
ncbi:MFS transporter [Achromobacter ruhlandii]|uniref:Major facilitator superfamily (MFS) profile domain-containing protein n=1 Tax=Achromobacter ruhlandii TaxID=72557 RepID=A0ABM8M2Q9_9BURK|nr:MFS transporter [Achromobacter ruhlandii]MCZ8433304.1 MFS transporter [Achromobacter ruhlandii]MDC6090882.1 MFS transporter [Achromobacter ruhlandii]MDC6148625.1 MFS transporter [Achromobacter ruhlandii]MDD7977834.1 MFS transporter [Achromobacter ruhlandii]WIW00554.1 MFS transporter [Achromobacter ruhlandii]